MDIRRYKVLLEWDPAEHVWVTTVPALNGISTYGETREEAIAQTREAILGYLEELQQEGIALPESTGDAELIDVEVALA